MIESSYVYKTGSTLALQVLVYDPDGTGDAAYGRYPLSAIFTAMIINALDNAFPGYTLTFGTIPDAATVAQVTANGLDDFNILYADTAG